jgi:hypothetical protein
MIRSHRSASTHPSPHHLSLLSHRIPNALRPGLFVACQSDLRRFNGAVSQDGEWRMCGIQRLLDARITGIWRDAQLQRLGLGGPLGSLQRISHACIVERTLTTRQSAYLPYPPLLLIRTRVALHRIAQIPLSSRRLIHGLDLIVSKNQVERRPSPWAIWAKERLHDALRDETFRA